MSVLENQILTPNTKKHEIPKSMHVLIRTSVDNVIGKFKRDRNGEDLPPNLNSRQPAQLRTLPNHGVQLILRTQALQNLSYALSKYSAPSALGFFPQLHRNDSSGVFLFCNA